MIVEKMKLPESIIFDIDEYTVNSYITGSSGGTIYHGIFAEGRGFIYFPLQEL